MRKKFFSLLVLLAAVATGAMAQEESLLTTLTFGESETYGETTSGVVNVTATNVGSYNGTYGWLLDEGGSLSVTAKEGYTITKCVFRQNAKTPITDTEAPFEIHTNYWGGIIEDPEEEMDGVTSIEVYGYANAGGGSTEVTVVFAANNKTAERTVTLPHTFKCSWDNGMEVPDELDIIIHELYNDYFYCNSNMNASGSDQVEAGTEEDPRNDYITIKGVFEGTATVTGGYLDYIAGDYGEHNYSLTISIKGDEPQPTGVENVQTNQVPSNQVQSTKVIRNGQLFIIRDGKTYNALGAEIK